MTLQIGVTGGIGSGKSIVCEVFGCLGIPVYKADQRAKWLTTNDAEIRSEIIRLLGEKAYRQDGSYNTPFVSSQIFQNPDLLKKVNGIIHPAVMQDTIKWMQERTHFPYLLKEAAIMNKAGENNSLDFVIVVEAPADLRVKRILQRDRRSEQEVRAIIERQATEEQRQAIADFTIQNNDRTALIPQVLALHQRFLGL